MRAADAAGNLSAYSAIATATTPAAADTTPPTAPSGLSATAASSTQINLGWTASTDNVGVTGYRVERCQGAGCTNFAQVATPTGTSFNDTGRSPSTTYRYQVRAADAAGNLSAYSSDRDATTPAAAGHDAPDGALGLSATAASSTQIDLGWTASTDNVGVTGYRVERCQGAGCTNFAQVATPTGTSYNDTGRSPSTTYRYRVRAADAAGNLGAYSAIATATTPAAAGHDAPDGAVGAERRRRRARPRSTSAGRPRPTTSASPAIGSSAARARAARTSPRSRPRPAPPTTTPASRPRPPTATGCARPMPPATWAPTRASRRRRRRPLPDTTPPTAPSGLTATAASSTQINLGWTASTDNVGVTGYRVERCQGAGCTNFAQVATPHRHLPQRLRPLALDHLPLPGARGRCRRQPGRLLRRGRGNDRRAAAGASGPGRRVGVRRGGRRHDRRRVGQRQHGHDHRRHLDGSGPLRQRLGLQRHRQRGAGRQARLR